MPRALGWQGSRENYRGDSKRIMMQNEERLRILFLPAWYPSEVNPVRGIFIKEHAKAASLYNDVVVLYAYPDPSPQFKGLYRVSEEIEEGIRTIRVRYGGILTYLWRKVKPKKQKLEGSIGSESKGRILAKLLRLPRMLILEMLYYWSIFSAFRKLIKGGWRPDIIHAHVFTAGVPAVILGKLYGIPVVITEHWTCFPRHILTLSDRIKARFAMNRARIILPVSEDLGRHIRAYGIKSKIKVVPPVVNSDIFYPYPFQNKGEGKSSKKILLVANITPAKGIPYLLEALSQLREAIDFSLDVIGDGLNRSEYEDLARRLKLRERVNFRGRLKTKEEIAEFMRQCDFYVQPSLWENLPSVIIEAMACGKPIIASDVGGVKEIMNKENGILVPPKDVAALRQAIKYMLHNCHIYSSKDIAEYARTRFSYEVIGKELDEIYRDVLAVKEI